MVVARFVMTSDTHIFEFRREVNSMTVNGGESQAEVQWLDAEWIPHSWARGRDEVIKILTKRYRNWRLVDCPPECGGDWMGAFNGSPLIAPHLASV